MTSTNVQWELICATKTVRTLLAATDAAATLDTPSTVTGRHVMTTMNAVPALPMPANRPAPTPLAPTPVHAEPDTGSMEMDELVQRYTSVLMAPIFVSTTAQMYLDPTFVHVSLATC